MEAGSGQQGALVGAAGEADRDRRRPRPATPAAALTDRFGARGWLPAAFLAAALLPAAALAAPQGTAEPHAALPGTAGTEPAAAEPVLLEPGRPITLTLAGGETRAFVFDLEAGRYARVEVEQRGVDVVATVLSPAGEILAEADGPDADRGTERASVLTEPPAQPGRFRLEVGSLDPAAPPGEIAVVLAEERPAAESDRDRIAAEREGYAAVALWGSGDPDKMPDVIAHYQRALEIWTRLGEHRCAAEVTTQLGFLHRNLGQINRQAEYFDAASTLWGGLGETAREAEMLINVSAAYSALGDGEKALAAATGAVDRFRALGDGHGEAKALSSLGTAHLQARSPLEGAEEAFNQALALNREGSDRIGEGRSLSNLAYVHWLRGEMNAAAEVYTQALAIARETGDLEGAAAALNNLSTTYEVIGDPARSLERYDEVLRLVRELGYRRGEAYALSNIGSLYRSLGEPEQAVQFLRMALEVFEGIGDRPAQAGTLDNIGGALLALDRAAEAIEPIERGLTIARDLDDAVRESSLLVTLARAHQALGKGEQALELAQAALEAAGSAGRLAEANALRLLGELHVDRGEPEAAIELLRTALAIHGAIGSRPAEAETLFRMARAERALGRLDEARSALEKAIEGIESVRSSVAVQDLRATYLASKQGYYEEWIGLLMELDRSKPGEGWDARAFEVAERARARTLLDALAEVEAEVRTGLDPALAAEEERLRYRLNLRERDRQQAAAAGDEAEATAAADDIRALAGEYRALEARIRNDSSRYADLVQPETLDAAAVQAQVLDPETLLLQYSLGRRESWLWAVTRGSLEAFRLPPREEIEAQTRRLYELLTARNLEVDGETPSARALRIEAADAAVPAAVTALAETVLGPVASRLRAVGSQRLVVVADGALHYVPFAILTKPGGTGDPLVVDHEVVSVPSASALAVLRRELASRRPPPRTLAVLADPVFDGADPRVARLGGTAPDAGPEDAARGAQVFRRLRFSRREAEEIAGLVPEEKRLTAYDFEASREVALDGLLADYRMVHFATHGVLNAEYPALSGLVLSLVDERGEPREGFLRVHDIYGLDLGADLVTLSACETALGREIRGEGLVGLARGFMYAGAARVVASLWSVQDRATAETMRSFYQGMLERGLTPAAALREAQISMSRQDRWAAAYYWAPFVVHGEWR